MSTDQPFAINVGSLKSRAKDTSPAAIEAIDKVAETHGFESRKPKGRRGRKPSPRTGQVHAKVLPHISEGISDEAKRRGVTQGVVLEEAWELYVAKESSKSKPG